MLLGVMYLVLAARRSRLCWIAGGTSSAILAVLAARALLPMQAALNIYYVAMSLYGFARWGRSGSSHGRIGIWPLRYHAIAWTVIVILSFFSAHLIHAQTAAAWPFLDSFTTWASLFITWLVARMKLENWLCWIVVDSILAYLFAAQHLYGFAALSAAYVGICIAGFLAWQRIYRSQVA